MEPVELNNYCICLLNFKDIFYKAYKDIVKDLYTYDRHHDYSVRMQDTKKIYYYHMIKHVCDSVINTKTTNNIVIYFSEKDIRCDFKQCSNERTRKGGNVDNRDDFVLFMRRFFKQLKGMLPVRVYMSDVKFDTFVQYFNTNKGRYIEIVNDMRAIRERKISLEKFKKFTSKFKLTYLTDNYLNSVKVKYSMYK